MLTQIRLILLPGLMLLCAALPAQAQLTIEITGGTEGALPVAVVPFGWQGAGGSAPENLADIISADLARSGRFKTLPTSDMLTMPSEASQIRFRNWQALGQDNLVIGRIAESGPGRYTVQFQLFDVYKGEQLTGYSFPVTRAELRRTAHRISDLIYEKITGEAGAFSSRIAYITAAPEKDKMRYRLLVADADGYNPRTVLSSAEPVMSPSWSPDGKQLAYVSFESKKASIFVQTLTTGKREQVASYPGINGAPAWSPDGQKLAMTLSKDGNPDIFVLDLGSRQLTKLTSSYAIDTEASWSPDGRNLIFTSDRGGKPQLYTVSSRGGSPRRLTFEGAYNTRGTYSPDGSSVAMVHAENGSYRVGILDLQSGALRVITPGKLDESPSFAPNGSMVLYAARQGSKGYLAAVSVDGKVTQKLVTDEGEVREPAWSPR